MKWRMMIVVLVLVGCLRANSVIENSSFEDDGFIEYISGQEPNGWPDVDLVVDSGGNLKFDGRVDETWKTDGSYSLKIYSKGPQAEPVHYMPYFYVGDEATICQSVYLADADYINFDIKLTSPMPSFFPWTPEKRTAIVYINDIVAWDSDALGSGNGVYLDQQIVLDDVNGLNKYEGPHTLKVAFRVNVEGEPDVAYHTQWDFLAFEPVYGLSADFSNDGVVNLFDFALIAKDWLQPYDYNDVYLLSNEWLMVE